jgi:predicted nucleotidyltransferase
MSETTRTPPTLADLRAQREAILALAERYGAYNVRVFGSVARGDAAPESDVDLLVQFRDGVSLYEISGLCQDLAELLGQTVDVVEDHTGLRERFRARALKDAVPL